jgi:beta-galactosidase
MRSIQLARKSLLAALLLSSLFLKAQNARHSFTLGDSVFLLDGRPFQMISGEIHYTRVPREAWRQRMKMAKAMGLNTIGTYVFWNMQEPEKGKFDFSGNNDIAAFVKTAQQEGLWVILRPSPYICAEWEFGGYPYWLEKENGLVVRSKEPRYLEEYKTYLREVGKQLAPLQVNHGGNILMVQVENEYGSYGSDKEYLDINRRLFIDAGFDGLLYTCDPPDDLGRGHLPGLLPAVNGIDQPQRIQQLIRAAHDGKGPFFIAEWYPAWFDWWGTKHHRVAAEQYVHKLDSVLAAGLSINMYMFHGGTTRGFMNGANYNDRNPYEPQISSYDYDAPLDEAGNPTKKFREFREVIQKHLPAGVRLPDIPPARPAIAIPSISFREHTSLFDLLPAPVSAGTPLTFEDLDQAYGYVLYRTELEGGASGSAGCLKINGLRDFGIVFINGRKTGVLDRRLRQDSLLLQLPAGKIRLDILVENLGRINFGPYLLKNKKGITGKVEWAGRELQGWQMFSLPFNDIRSIRYKTKISSATAPAHTDAPRSSAPHTATPPTTAPPSDAPPSAARLSDGVPVVRKGNFRLEKTADTYLDMSDWGKGCVWVNGHHLGRYWEIGPQQTLFLPAEWLKKGDNEIVVFELLKPEMSTLKGIDHPILDVLKSMPEEIQK